MFAGHFLHHILTKCCESCAGPGELRSPVRGHANGTNSAQCMQSRAADRVCEGFAWLTQTSFVCNIRGREYFNQVRPLEIIARYSSKPLKSSTVRKMGVDLLSDRKLAASISGHRRIEEMYTTLI